MTYMTASVRFASMIRDVLGSTEQFCHRAKEAGGEGAAWVGVAMWP